MNVKIIFQSVSGQSFSGNFLINSNTHQISSFIAKKLKLKENKIFLVSNNPGECFYKGNEKISNIIHNNPYYITFYNLNFKTESNKLTNNNIIMQNTKMIKPPLSALKVFSNTRKIRHINPICMMLYRKYSSIIRNVPWDFENKINQISQLGYDREDCKEVLRETNYDVEISIDILIHRYNDNSREEDENMMPRSHFFASPFSQNRQNAVWGMPPESHPTRIFRHDSDNSESDDEDQNQTPLQSFRPITFRNAPQMNHNRNQQTTSADRPSNDQSNSQSVNNHASKKDSHARPGRPDKPHSPTANERSSRGVMPPTQSDERRESRPKTSPKKQAREENTSQITPNRNENQSSQNARQQRTTFASIRQEQQNPGLPNAQANKSSKQSAQSSNQKTKFNEVGHLKPPPPPQKPQTPTIKRAVPPTQTQSTPRHSPNCITAKKQTQPLQHTKPTNMSHHLDSADDEDATARPSLMEINKQKSKADTPSSHSSSQRKVQKTVELNNSPSFSNTSQLPGIHKKETKQSVSNSGDISSNARKNALLNSQTHHDAKSGHVTSPVNNSQSKSEVPSPNPRSCPKPPPPPPPQPRPSPHLPERPKTEPDQQPFNGRRRQRTDKPESENERGSRVRMSDSSKNDHTTDSPLNSNKKKKE